MREIKFRGKRIDNGKWACGYYACHRMMLTGETDYFIIVDEQRPQSIAPETVGQYTGLKDKNGKDVYEGDIVNCSRGCPHVIEWVQEYGATFIGGMPAFYLSGLKDGYAWTGEEEVVGNIYENAHPLVGVNA